MFIPGLYQIRSCFDNVPYLSRTYSVDVSYMSRSFIDTEYIWETLVKPTQQVWNNSEAGTKHVCSRVQPAAFSLAHFLFSFFISHYRQWGKFNCVFLHPGMSLLRYFY